MISCENREHWLDAYLDGGLPPQRRAEVSVHLADCDVCRQKLRSARELQRMLATMPPPPEPPELAERQFARLWDAQEKPPSRWPQWLQPSLVASLFLGILLGGSVMKWWEPAAAPSQAMVTVELYDTREVKFVVTAGKDIQQARVTLQIPEHMELEGFPGRHQLVWNTPLKAGANLLSLPLKASQPGSGEIVMVIDSSAGRVARKTVWIRAGDSKLTGQTLSEVRLG